MTRFGDLSPLCSHTPSYPWCNLFYRQLLRLNDPSILINSSADPVSAPVGINPECGIPRLGFNGSLGNIANIITCALSMFVVAALIFFTFRRKAAVGRLEICAFFALYFLSLPLQLITTGSLIAQGTTPLVAITAIHAGTVATLFWALLANAIVATQIVEDGTLSSLVPFGVFSMAIFAVTTYVSFDVALGITTTIGSVSDPPTALHNTPLFILTSLWPGVTVILYFSIMTYVVVSVLNQFRPMWYFVLVLALFLLSQLDYFLLSKFICKGSTSKLDGSFIATILETAAVGVLYLAWRSITEDSWAEDSYYP